MRNSELENLTREEKIKQIGSYFEKTGNSTREIAKYFTKNFFPISNKTVSVYIHEYMKNHSHSEIIEAKIDNNREKSYLDEEIQKQVLLELGLLLKEYTLEEIAQIQDKSPSSVQRDLTSRLKRLGETDIQYHEFYKQAQQILVQHQISTIEENRKK